MALMIKRLHDYKKQRSVKVSDIGEERFSDSKVVDYRGNKYNVYEYGANEKFIDNDHVHSKILFKGDIEDSPVSLFTNKDGQLTVNQPSLVDELYKTWGNGQYRVYKFGGNPPTENFFKNRFIEKIEESERRHG